MMSVSLMSLTLVVAVSLISVHLVKGTSLSSDFIKDFQGNESKTEYFGEEGDFFEGDIILRPEQLAFIKAKSGKQSGRTLIADPTAIWPDKTVYYAFAPQEFSQAQENTIIHALNDIMSVSCVRFVQRTTQSAYVVLRNNGRGCAAAVGYHNYGPLDLYLGGPTCQTRGTIQHEFLHTLGFWHEHTRPDRDDHVTIVWPNIYPGKEFNFYKRDPSEIMTLNMPYDYGSVMHYRSIAFSRDLVSSTIVPKIPSAAIRMGQRIRFSQVDLAKLNRLYKCTSRYYNGDDIAGKAAIIGDIDEALDMSDLNHPPEEDEVLKLGVNITPSEGINVDETENTTNTKINLTQNPNEREENNQRKYVILVTPVNKKTESVLEKEMQNVLEKN